MEQTRDYATMTVDERGHAIHELAETERRAVEAGDIAAAALAKHERIIAEAYDDLWSARRQMKRAQAVIDAKDDYLSITPADARWLADTLRRHEARLDYLSGWKIVFLGHAFSITPTADQHGFHVDDVFPGLRDEIEAYNAQHGGAE